MSYPVSVDIFSPVPSWLELATCSRERWAGTMQNDHYYISRRGVLLFLHTDQTLSFPRHQIDDLLDRESQEKPAWMLKQVERLGSLTPSRALKMPHG